MKTSIAYTWTIWNSDYTQQSFGLSDNQVVINGTPALTSESPYVSNLTYQCLFMLPAIKSIVGITIPPLRSRPNLGTLDDLEGAEITSLAVSPDNQQLYVGVYQPQASGFERFVLSVELQHR